MGSAIISPCGTYRYLLTRRWAEAGPSACFVMLNPSTADAEVDDPTIRRCIGFAKREGCALLTVVNLYGLRATDPADLVAAIRAGRDAVGPDNVGRVRHALREADIRIAAWGAHPAATMLPAGIVRGSIRPIVMHALGVTRDGEPRHPLYLRSDAPLTRWVPDGAAEVSDGG